MNKIDDSLEKEDMLKEESDTLCAQAATAINFPPISKNDDAPHTSQPIKLIAFMITVLIVAVCIIVIQFYAVKHLKQSIIDLKQQNSLPQHSIEDSNQAQIENKNKQLVENEKTQNKLLKQYLQKVHQDQQYEMLVQEIRPVKEKNQENHKMLQTPSMQGNHQENKQHSRDSQKLKKQSKSQPLPSNIIVGRQRAQPPSHQDIPFIIPKTMWLYEEKPNNFLAELIEKNLRHFAEVSEYEVIMLNSENFKAYLSQAAREVVEGIITSLNQRLKSGKSGNLNDHISNISKQLVLLSVLAEKGGVITTGGFALTEDLNWLQTIASNQYAIRGNRGAKPQLAGFYSPYYSSPKAKENLMPFPGMHEVDKLITLYPAIEGYFIAASSQCEFLLQILKKVNTLLLQPQQFKLQKNHYHLPHLSGEDIYYEYFLIANQMVLQDKQKELDSIYKDSYRHLAIDYYGLYLINCKYGPYKFKAFWGESKAEKIFQSMSQYTQEQFEANVGPNRYIAKLSPEKQINEYLEMTRNGKSKQIMYGSFIQKLFFPEGNSPLLTNSIERPLIKSDSKKWTALPKIIWIFWDQGISNSKISNQLCFENIKKMGKLSGFQVNEVNLSNIDQYLDSDTINKIHYALSNSKLQTYAQSQGDLYRLALLARHGGVYMDASYIALEHFDWLVNIASYPSQYIFNRIGQLPKVFVMWHPHYGSPLDWNINQKHNTKVQWHLSYENNFIAAEKGSELIKDWFQLLLSLYVQPYKEVEQIFKQCEMYNHKWIRSNWHYLLAMDAFKCTVGQKETLLKGSSWINGAQYYGLWSMSGYLGQQKFRKNTNFENEGSNDHVFLYAYSQEYVEGIIGKVHHVTKFYSSHNDEISKFVTRHKDGNFSGDAHPESIFMRYMWKANYVLQQGSKNLRLRVMN